MTLRLTVAHSIEELADRLADELARPLPDPFTPELVAVPGDGIKSWLTARLGSRLGVTDSGGDGVVANVRFVFPGGLVRRALGRSSPSDPWSVGPLTWAVYDALHDPADRGAQRLGIRADAMRCRSIADLFDRYALHRRLMMRRWEHGHDVDESGRPLAGHLRWQPELWRMLVDRVGAPSDVESIDHEALDLAAGRLTPDVPERVFLVGLTSLPAPHLQVLAALSRQVDVHVFAPAPSLAVWERLRERTRTVPLVLPLVREHDDTVALAAHPLGGTWGRAAREAHLLLVGTAMEEGAEIEVLPGAGQERAEPHGTGHGTGPTLLERLQDDVRADRSPPGAPADGEPDERFVLRPDDHSVQWHTCNGAARQAEVLRDAVAHLLEEHDLGEHDHHRPRYEPRDVTVLCPDVQRFAPLVEAAFRGDPDHGVPTIPLRVADRSLRQQNPVLDAAVALLDLLDGRFRVSEVLAFAALAPVARRFGFGPEQLEMLTTWATETHVHWGADADAHELNGLPADLGAFTWRDGLDQLLVGAAMSDPAMSAAAGDVPADDTVAAMRFGPGSTLPAVDVEGDAVAVAGALADLVHELHHAVSALATDAPIGPWCAAFAAAADALFEVTDLDSWQRRDLDAELTAFEADAVIGQAPFEAVVPADELATLVAERLTGRPGRVRFGSGAVTLSSLTAQRGVPHRVVCLLGIDGDMSGPGSAAADDLMAVAPCVGDRDARGELRAQLLDAIMSAADRVVILSTGVDIRTNAHVPAAVPLAELADVIDATARTSPYAGPPMRSLTVRHPRQPWAEVNFVPGRLIADRPWGFDTAALGAARARRQQRPAAPFLSAPLAPVGHGSAGHGMVSLAELVEVVANPASTLLSRRLGLSMPRAAENPSDLLPLRVESLEAWWLKESQLRARLASGANWNADRLQVWNTAQQRAGAVPPLVAGRRVLDDTAADVERLVDALQAECGLLAFAAPEMVSIDVDLVDLAEPGNAPLQRLVGAVHGVSGDLVLEVTPSRVQADRLLRMWVRLAALVAAQPARQSRAVIIGRPPAGTGVTVHRMSLRSPHAANEILDVVIDLYRRASCDVVPAFPRTARCLHRHDLKSARKEWSSKFGERDNEWIHAVLGPIEFDELLADPARDDERWGDGASRIEQWAERLWGTFERTTDLIEESPP